MEKFKQQSMILNEVYGMLNGINKNLETVSEALRSISVFVADRVRYSEDVKLMYSLSGKLKSIHPSDLPALTGEPKKPEVKETHSVPMISREHYLEEKKVARIEDNERWSYMVYKILMGNGKTMSFRKLNELIAALYPDVVPIHIVSPVNYVNRRLRKMGAEGLIVISRNDAKGTQVSMPEGNLDPRIPEEAVYDGTATQAIMESNNPESGVVNEADYNIASIPVSMPTGNPEPSVSKDTGHTETNDFLPMMEADNSDPSSALGSHR